MLRADVVQRAVQLAVLSRPGHSISWIGWVFWALSDTPTTAQKLRAELVRTLMRPLVRAGVEEIPRGDSDKEFQARTAAAARLLKNRRSPRQDLDGALRSSAAAVGVELPPAPADSVRNPFARTLVEPGARLLLGGSADVGFEGLMEALESVLPQQSETIDRLRALHHKAELEGIDLMAQSPLGDGVHGLVRAVEDADDQLLCAAVRTCTRASGVLSKLWMRVGHTPEILRRLMTDVMWDQWVRVGGLAPSGVAGEAAVAICTVRYLMDTDWAQDLHRYLAMMETLLLDPLVEPGRGDHHSTR
jgi:hypothetical protein